MEFFENDVVFSLCEDDVSSLRRKSLPHSEQNFAVSSNFSSQLNGHSGFGHFIAFFFADSWASIVQLSPQTRVPIFKSLPFMPISDSWKGGSCFRERNPHDCSKVDTELARKKWSTNVIKPIVTRAISRPMAVITELESSVREGYNPN